MSRTPELIQARPVPRPSVRIWAGIVLLFAALFIYGLFTNENYRWDVVGQHLFDPRILAGVGWTLLLTVAAMLLGIVMALTMAIMRMGTNPILRGVSWAYIWFFRGTPVITQLTFWGLLGVLYPKIVLGIPFGPEWVTADSSKLITQFTAAILGLGLAAAGYMAEIIRAGILSVNSGQIEAAESLGMSRGMVLRRILLPQAMRMIIPPTGNEMISTLKGSSIVIVIAYSELMTSVQTIYSQTFETIPLLIVASIWYLVLTTVLGLGQRYIEKYFSRGYTRRTMKAPKAMTITGDVR